MTCEICRGFRIIRLPRYKSATTASFKDSSEQPTAAIEDGYKEYPCPECAPIGAKDMVRVVECTAEATTMYEDQPGYREYVVRNAVHQLVNEIERGGYARIQISKENRELMRRTYRVSVGVVAPRVVAELDKDRFAAEEKFADLVLKIAAAEIDNWGSYYAHPDILKRDAKRLLWAAMDKAKRTRPKEVA